MSESKRLIFSLLAALLLWGAFTWPLPRYISEAVPYSSQAYHDPGICSMTPGDHLQYLYFLVLVKDMLFGETPLFYNLYEFNTGDDQLRYEPDPYYLPFVLLFSLFTLFGSDAFAWNLLGLVTTWISAWSTWLLVRRYCDRDWVAGVAAIATMAMPFRWASILGGSTIGPALIWMPLTMLGLDLAVREDRKRGGFLAGISLLFALWTDMHAFFFCALIVPGWCIVAMIKRGDFDWCDWASYRRLIVALIPVPLFLFAAIFIRHLHTQHLVAESTRTWNEAALFSPYFKGVFHVELGVTGHIFLGYAAVALMLMGILALLFAWRSRRGERFPSREASLFLLLLAGGGGILVLALGTFGPSGGKIFDLARAHVPFYSNIRQSAKIYCLMPPVLAAIMVLSHQFAARRLRRRHANVIWLALVSWFIFACFRHVQIAMTWLELEQGAYAAVARDAETRDVRTGTLIVPLWPGDSHFASVYQMYSVHYRIKMVNGYSPTPDSKYRGEIYEPFASVNHGVLTDEQIDALLARGIHYLVVHQNLYPEKVSPFPVGETLVRLINHPRVEWLAQDQRVWSFRLLEHAVEKEPIKPGWNFTFPARRIEAERLTTNASSVIAEEDAGGRAFVRLQAGDSVGGIDEPAPPSDRLAWLVRLRGTGVVDVVSGYRMESSASLPINQSEWTWHRVPVPSTRPQARAMLSMSGRQGSVDVDTMMLVIGDWPELAPGQSAEITAARFFHAGYMDIEKETVKIEHGVDAPSIAFYGPKWPMVAGRYEVEMIFSSPAPDGTDLGLVNLEEDDVTGRGATVRVVAGQPAKGVMVRKDNLPVNVVYVYSGRSDITIEKVVFKRLE